MICAGSWRFIRSRSCYKSHGGSPIWDSLCTCSCTSTFALGCIYLTSFRRRGGIILFIFSEPNNSNYLRSSVVYVLVWFDLTKFWCQICFWWIEWAISRWYGRWIFLDSMYNWIYSCRSWSRYLLTPVHWPLNLETEIATDWLHIPTMCACWAQQGTAVCKQRTEGCSRDCVG